MNYLFTIVTILMAIVAYFFLIRMQKNMKIYNEPGDCRYHYKLKIQMKSGSMVQMDMYSNYRYLHIESLIKMNRTSVCIADDNSSKIIYRKDIESIEMVTRDLKLLGDEE